MIIITASTFGSLVSLSHLVFWLVQLSNFSSTYTFVSERGWKKHKALSIQGIERASSSVSILILIWWPYSHLTVKMEAIRRKYHQNLPPRLPSFRYLGSHTLPSLLLPWIAGTSNQANSQLVPQIPSLLTFLWVCLQQLSLLLRHPFLLLHWFLLSAY